MTDRLLPTLRSLACAAAVCALGACTGAAAHDAADAPPRARSVAPVVPVAPVAPSPGGVVDSIIPIDEALRRFRVGIGDAPRALAGSASRGELLSRFARAVEARDTAALRALAISRGDFAFLYYPESPLSRPPYEEPPGLLWLRIHEGSARGLGRLLRRYGGQPLRVVSHACEATPRREGANRLWERCRVRHVRAAGDTVSERLFGSILERDGRYAFVGYANDF